MTEQQRQQKRDAGRLGGQRTATTHGPSYMATIGKKGFVGLAKRLGDNGAAVSFLQHHKGMPKRARKDWTHDKCWQCAS